MSGRNEVSAGVRDDGNDGNDIIIGQWASERPLANSPPTAAANGATIGANGPAGAVAASRVPVWAAPGTVRQSRHDLGRQGTLDRRPGPAVANLETIVSLSKRRGFVFPSSEIYGGINAVWDYGPLGVELKNNVKRAWWRAMVQERDEIVGLDAGHPDAPPGLGHVRPRRLVQRPHGRVPDRPPALSASTSCPAPRTCPRPTCAIRRSSSASASSAPTTAARCPRPAGST